MEVLVAAAILVLFMGGLYHCLALGLSMWEKGQEEMDQQQNIRIAANHMAREIRTAYSFDIGAPGPSPEPQDSIEIRIPQSDVPLGKYKTIRYYFDGGNEIQRSVNGQGNNIVAYGIKGLSFSQEPVPGLVTIRVEGTKGYRLETRVFIRGGKREPQGEGQDATK